MANIFQKLTGIIGDSFKIGVKGNLVKNSVDGLEIRKNDDSDYSNLKVARATANDHAVTLRDLKDNNILLEYDFDGASIPVAGTNANKYGICSKTGGTYTQGQVVYDNGTALELISIYKGEIVASSNKIEVAGGLNMIQNGLYIATVGSPNPIFVAKGDGSENSTGKVRYVKLPLALIDATSTTSIPVGSKIVSCQLNVKTAYDNSATLAIATTGTTPLSIMSATDSDLSLVGMFEVDALLDVATGNDGTVKVTITGTPTVGAGEVIIGFEESYLA